MVFSHCYYQNTLFLQMELLPLSQTLDATKKKELQVLLDQFQVLFESPTELPPSKTHDHHIPLNDES